MPEISLPPPDVTTRVEMPPPVRSEILQTIHDKGQLEDGSSVEDTAIKPADEHLLGKIHGDESSTSLSGIKRILKRVGRKSHGEHSSSDAERYGVDVSSENDGRFLAESDKNHEIDEMVPVPLPTFSEVEVAGRDIEIKKGNGETATEAQYIEEVKDILSDHPEIISKIQWLGEAELVHAVSSQTSWLVARILAGEHMVVIDEAWHRTETKSGGYLTRMIVDLARQELTRIGQDKLNNNLVMHEDLWENTLYPKSRAVIFEDWTGSGHDMTYRARWSAELMEEYGIARDRLTINLLAAQKRHVENGFDPGAATTNNIGPGSIKVLSPYVVEGWVDGHGYIPFSGIHSSMDYAFTIMPQVADASGTSMTNFLNSRLSIRSSDTLGNQEFNSRVMNKARVELEDALVKN